MSAIPIADARLRTFAALLLPAFVGHTLQLLTEDLPWTELAERRFWVTPGWHLYLPPAAPLAIAVALAIAVVALAATRARSRAALLALIVLYAAHYLTYPWRIRNHMTTMLAGLGVIALVWIVARTGGALTARSPRAREVDGAAATGLAAVIVVQYFFAGLHKMNPVFTDPSLDGESVVIRGLTTLWIYGDLGSVPPAWAIATGIWGTLVIELAVPFLAWRFRALTIPGVLVLMAFHFPHVSALDIPDYPLIASAFYPSLFTDPQWRRVLARARPSPWTVLGGVAGGGAQIWFMPWWGPMSIFGIFVLSLWGWAAGAMLHAWWTSIGTKRARREQRRDDAARGSARMAA